MQRLRAFFERNGRPGEVIAGERLFRQGDVDANACLVTSGLLKAYYVSTDGRLHIKSFLSEGAVIGSMNAMLDDAPSTFTVSAIERSTFIAVPYSRLDEARRGDAELANALADFFASLGRHKERREHELLSLSAEQRLASLIERTPDIARRISQADLAAYIGITPQALSRIKRRVEDRMR